MIETPAGMPLGYIYDEAVIAANVAACSAAGVDLNVTRFEGACAAKIKAGTAYENLQDFTFDFIASEGDELVKSQRRIAPSGILEPFGQQTGICDGCSFSEGGWVAWCVNFIRNGQGPTPREVLFVAPYLAGRHGLTGDSGAYPSYSARAYHDWGLCPVDVPGPYDFRSMPPHGPNSQEAVAVALRDSKRVLNEWLDTMSALRCRVFKPQSVWSCADCVASGFPVTMGSSMQINFAQPTGSGVSSLYQLRDKWGRPAGHETLVDGWFTQEGRLGFIKRESWWNILFPGKGWPDNRVTIRTDEGPRTLYEGQGACWADEWWNIGKPEPWAIGFPGTAT